MSTPWPLRPRTQPFLDRITVIGSSTTVRSIEERSSALIRGRRSPFNTLINAGPDDIVWIGRGAAGTPLLMANTAGNGFLCKLGDLATKTRQGKDFMSVPQGGKALPPFICKELSDQSLVAALSSDARLLLFPIDELPTRPNGGVGVQIMALPDKVSLAGVAVTDGATLTVSGFKRSRKTAAMGRKDLADFHGKRAQRGKVCDVGFPPDKLGA